MGEIYAKNFIAISAYLFFANSPTGHIKNSKNYSTLTHSQCDASNITFCNFCCFRCVKSLNVSVNTQRDRSRKGVLISPPKKTKNWGHQHLNIPWKFYQDRTTQTRVTPW